MAKKDKSEVEQGSTVVDTAVEDTGAVSTETGTDVEDSGVEDTGAVSTETDTDVEDTGVDFAEVDEIAVIVLKRFRDKFDHKTWYEAGSELSFDPERANDLVSRGLAKAKE